MVVVVKDVGVLVVIGDIKVVECGKGDGVFIMMIGVGIVVLGDELFGCCVKVGDVILIFGMFGDYGMVIMVECESLGFELFIVFDMVVLYGLIVVMCESGVDIYVLCDLICGGLVMMLNEIVKQFGVGMMLQEKILLINLVVVVVCEFFGLDLFYVVNEGKLVVICVELDVGKLLVVMCGYLLGVVVVVIGSVYEDGYYFVQMIIGFGGKWIVDWLFGEQFL